MKKETKEVISLVFTTVQIVLGFVVWVTILAHYWDHPWYLWAGAWMGASAWTWVEIQKLDKEE